MRLDPAEEKFDLPASLVERGDFDGWTLEIIGEDRKDPAVIASDPHPAQRNGKLSPALARQLDLGIPKDGEAIAFYLFQLVPARDLERHIGLWPRDKGAAGLMNPRPPSIAAIALVEGIDRAGLDRRLFTDRNIVDGRRCDLDALGVIARWIVNDMELEASGSAVPIGPANQLVERDWA